MTVAYKRNIIKLYTLQKIQWRNKSSHSFFLQVAFIAFDNKSRHCKLDKRQREITLYCEILFPTASFSEGSDSFLRDQRLGIVIGCAIGLTSIIVCILVIVLRQRSVEVKDSFKLKL